ncbi:efflux RND transporter permease subunit [Roseiterribacter gracilis]|uniref:RND transporter n=1 Tax=Roseiterribacter gracilis TaxID=2812848 RepID=A0A8S8XG25_9PROT|nr:RND transporter [Rhodospirillales bacterium TMPK1]
MWIVRLALARPHTFLVLALVILVMGTLSVRTMPTDIFPKIDIPVVSVIWSYPGLSADEMEKRVTTYSEFSLASGVDDVKSIDSQTMPGVAIMKVGFHNSVDIQTALAQAIGISNVILRRMPVGMTPPTVVRFNASSVPILQVSLGGGGLGEAQLYDFGLYRIRQLLSQVQGATLPVPYGGKPRQIMVDLEPASLLAKGVTPADVMNAITAQNLTLPSGSTKIGDTEYAVRLNAGFDTVAAIGDAPVRAADGQILFVRDVASVRDGFRQQQNVVRADGQRSALLTVIKNGSASTLDIIDRIKNEVLPQARAIAPPGMQITELFDQSIFVRAAVDGVVREGIIAACLTAAMILLFLGSWRSTLIVAVSIPLSILASIALLAAMGHSLNVMTLGGLALAIGILVDDATVTIENIHRVRTEQHGTLYDAILEGAGSVAMPTLVATLAICIVFVSVVFLDGPARFLFTPMALAVVFAMLASYVLSRTLVPVLAMYLLPGEKHGEPPAGKEGGDGFFARFHAGFEARFETVRAGYVDLLKSVLAHPRKIAFAALGVVAVSGVAMVFVGQDFFPAVDAGQIRLHVRAPTGLKLEATEKRFQAIEDVIREVIPVAERKIVLDNIGVAAEAFNLAFEDGSSVGTYDGQILISLNENHGPTEGYVRKLRTVLNERFPDTLFYFQPADIVNQILNFGLPAPIDIQVAGQARVKNYEIARKIEGAIKGVAGVVDVHMHQVVDSPEIFLDVDRARIGQMGLTQQTVANDVLVALSSSATVSPNFYLDPKAGIPYTLAVQTPEVRQNNIDALTSIAVTPPGASAPQLLGNVAQMQRRKTQVVFNHRDAQPVYDIYASVQGRDLGSIASDLKTAIAPFEKELPPGSKIVMRGQVESMGAAFTKLGIGLVFAALLVFLLMVVNFQSWLDPAIIVMALPGALIGVVWGLFLTGTTFSVPSLMGAIMALGVASANSILLVSFAKERQGHGLSPYDAALDAAHVRLRPIVMTALAMVVGMIPMALGLGEGGEQNAPLGRAVIGGLLVATFATLFIVPVIYTVIHRRRSSGAEVVT